MTISVSRHLFAAGLAMLCAGAANATHYIELNGSNAQFFYDADVWGSGNVAVVGNAIMFSDLNYANSLTLASAPVDTVRSTRPHAYLNSVVAIAHSGYALTGEVVGGISAGSYALSAVHNGNGAAMLSDRTVVASGKFSAGLFTYETEVGDNDHYLSIYANRNQATSSHFDAGGMAANPPVFSLGQYSTLGLSYAFLANELVLGSAGALTSTIDSARYDFTVAAVPEPESYAMLLLGLGLLGVAARRRRMSRT